MSELLLGHRLCVFDADDTLRRTTLAGRPCPRTPGEWRLIDGVTDVLRAVRWNRPGGPFLGLASNQDQVGYGHLTESTARMLLRDLAWEAAGIVLPDEALQLCPHRLEIDCECRKPRPGMLLRLMKYYRVMPGETLFVGNSETDRRAAEAAGTGYADMRAVFSSSGAPSGRRTRQTPPLAEVGWCGAAEGRRTRE